MEIIITFFFFPIGDRATANRNPVIIVDLDNTILNPSRRKARSFLDAVKAAGRAMDDPEIVSGVQSSAGKSFDFKPMKEIVDKVIDDLAFRRFLSNDYLVSPNNRVMDDPVPGSVDFLTSAARNGCDIQYLTGRQYEEWQDRRKRTTPFTGMVPGTMATLRRHGYPVPVYPATGTEPVRIAFKDKKARKDEEFKTDEMKKVPNIVAVFDDNKKFLDLVKEKYPVVSRVAVMIYPDMKGTDFGCLPRSQKRITEYTGETNRGAIECIADFSRARVDPGCTITVNGRKIT
jgi:phosphoglycolate phosphatase-like HAD superfamily hydrolase